MYLLLTGIYYDKDGVYKKVWPPEDEREYIERAQCFIDKFSNYTVPGAGGLKVMSVLC